MTPYDWWSINCASRYVTHAKLTHHLSIAVKHEYEMWQMKMLPHNSCSESNYKFILIFTPHKMYKTASVKTSGPVYWPWSKVAEQIQSALQPAGSALCRSEMHPAHTKSARKQRQHLEILPYLVTDLRLFARPMSPYDIMPQNRSWFCSEKACCLETGWSFDQGTHNLMGYDEGSWFLVAPGLS